MAVTVSPARCPPTATWNIADRRRAQRTVHTGRAGAVFHTEQRCARNSAATAHPSPLVRGRIELPDIVETRHIAVGIVASTPKEPEIAALVSPACGRIS